MSRTLPEKFRSRVVDDMLDKLDLSALVGPVQARHDVSTTPAPDGFGFHAIARRSDPRRVVGAKPAAFAGWIFALLRARIGDTFDDLFPGSGGMSRAWSLFCRPDLDAGADGWGVADAV